MHLPQLRDPERIREMSGDISQIDIMEVVLERRTDLK
jgi:hypothetical protein